AIPWNTLAVLALMIGFALVFIGTVVVVAWGTPMGSCGAVPPTCNVSDFRSGLFNALWAGKMLWALGLAGIGAGAGIKLHWGPKVARGSPAEEYNFVSAERRRYTLLFVISLVLLAVLMLSVGLISTILVP
ncbi:MAG: hypothetical protein L3K08_07870, partial [Thermoplasmata archaeon]|nr:hypothetical protein [Thermoplasmata archaeon]